MLWTQMTEIAFSRDAFNAECIRATRKASAAGSVAVSLFPELDPAPAAAAPAAPVTAELFPADPEEAPVNDAPANDAPAAPEPPAPAPSAYARRCIALGMINALYFPAATGYKLRLPAGGPAEMAENIEKLAALGRTARWQSAIATWAAQVREDAGTDHLVWAFQQYGIYAGHAAS